MTAARRIAGLLAVGLVAPAAAAADPAQVSTAITKGAEFLRRGHAPAPAYAGGPHGQGSAALVGLALLEAGVKPEDPAVQNITRFVRAGCLANNQTYHVALAIVFLDRLGDPADVPTIQYLGVRLYAGMTAFGGWSYQSGEPAQGAEEARLRAALQQNVMVGKPRGDKDPPRPGGEGFLPPGEKKKPDPDAPPARLHPEAARYFQAVRQAVRAGGRGGMEGDNSNTQFGIIGLWVAARHGVPADDAFALIEQRFLTTQHRIDGGWTYSGGPVGSGGSTVAMTCAGLLGLAVGAARTAPPPPPKPDPKTPKSDDPFDNPKKRAEKPSDGVPAGVGGQRKAAIAAGLALVARGMQNAPNPQAVPITGSYTYYTVWSVERVAVAFGLATIGGVDWYKWGADFLIPDQKSDGSWGDGDVDTSFAILFLARSNFVRDLTRKIGGDVTDTELRGGAGALTPPPLSGPGSEGGTKPQPGATAPKDPGTPPIPPVGPGAQDPIAEGLVSAADADWEAKLRAARDTKGGEQTTGLVRAIGRLDGERKKQARDALAERLTRMTAKTLRTMLRDDEPELRRAACLACAMKDDRSHVPDLIDRITDASDLVVRAARAGLVSLTEKDFGPPSGADEAAKSKAQAEWRQWYESMGKP